MTNSEMRNWVSALYPGKSWKEKVSDMPDRQVYAIFMSAKKRGQQPVKAKIVDKKDSYHQMTISEWLDS
jgi:hypothetical protein